MGTVIIIIINITITTNSKCGVCLGHFLPPVSSSLGQDLSARHTTYTLHHQCHCRQTKVKIATLIKEDTS